MTNFKRLCEITAEMIDTEKVSNPALKRLFRQLIHKQGDTYVFSFLFRKGHRDYKEHTDANYTVDDSSYHTDETEHDDHTEHYDYNETTHTDNKYSEASYHTESSAHEDHNETVHRDT